MSDSQFSNARNPLDPEYKNSKEYLMSLHLISFLAAAVLSVIGGCVATAIQGGTTGQCFHGALYGLLMTWLLSIVLESMIWIFTKRMEPIALLIAAGPGIMAGARLALQTSMANIVIALIVCTIVGAIMGVVAALGRFLRSRRQKFG